MIRFHRDGTVAATGTVVGLAILAANLGNLRIVLAVAQGEIPLNLDFLRLVIGFQVGLGQERVEFVLVDGGWYFGDF